jgi:hypothetical protein
MPKISPKQFAFALKTLDPHSVRYKNVRKFLCEHYTAKGRVCTMTNLARAAGYKSYGGVNLQYGKLAYQIAEILNIGVPPTALLLLAEFVGPKTQSNAHWQIVMRPEFAAALEDVGWV